MFKYFRKPKAALTPEPKRSAFSTGVYQHLAPGKMPQAMELEQPTIAGVAMDSSLDGTVPIFKGNYWGGVPEAQAMWYASQGFIGHQIAAMIAKHWLVDKACTMPARDAIRQGYKIDAENQDVIDKLTHLNKQHRINYTMREFVRRGRAAGGQVALFNVSSTAPDYYELPFNLDGVTPGAYKGITLIDPVNVQPDLTEDCLNDPASQNYYSPKFWRIGNRRYHHSHLAIFVPYPVSNVLKPSYGFFGVSVPERVYERVYAAERSANEAPQLLMTKRLLTMGIPGLENADNAAVAENIAWFVQMRDNYGVQISDNETTFNQFDTALGDVDALLMTQYQLVAAGANVPATKLLGTTPKGFNASGEYEEAVYREELESIQTNDLEPLLERHHELLTKSEGITDAISVQWNPLDSPTSIEYADIALKKAQAAATLQQTGAIDGQDIRAQIKGDKESDYFGLEDFSDETDEEA
jgi:phage-related protein (TIGR01555 family)